MAAKCINKLMELVLEDSSPELSVISEEEKIYKGFLTWCVPKSDIERCFNIVGKYVYSKYFTIGHADNYRIYFVLYPNGIDESSKHQIFLHLKFEQKLSDGVEYYGKLTLPGKDGNLYYSREFDDTEFTLEMITFDDIGDTGNLKKFFTGENLILKCSIQIIVSSVQCVADNQNSSRHNYGNFEPQRCNRNILMQSTFSDVTFRVHGGVVHAHKAFLALNNPVFRILFSGAPASENYFKLKDIDIETFKHLLNFLYTKEIPDLNFKLACDCCVGAHNFKIFDLKNLCLCYLAANLTSKNVFIVSSVAHKCKDASLKKACIEFIQNCDPDTLAKESVHVTE